MEGQGVASSLVPLGAPPDLNGLALPCQAPTSAPPQKPGALQSPKGVYPLLQSCTRSRATKGRAVLRDSRPWVSSEKLTPQVSWPLFLTASSQQPTPAVAMTRGARGGTMMMRGAHRGLTCPGGRRRSPHYASRSRRSKRSREASPAPLFAWRTGQDRSSFQGEILPVEGCMARASSKELIVRLSGTLGVSVKRSHGEGPAPRCPLRCPAFLESSQAQSASRPHQPAAPSIKGVLRNSVLSQRNSEFG